jgi:uncharacterized membrane protein YqiK
MALRSFKKLAEEKRGKAEVAKIRKQAKTEAKVLSTYDEYVQSLSKAKRKKFDQGYRDLLLSEFLLALADGDEASALELAKAAGASLTIIKELESGRLTVKSLFKILKALDCTIIIMTGTTDYSVRMSGK